MTSLPNDVLSSALIKAIGRDLSVADLVRSAETLKLSGQLASVETLYGSWVQHNTDHPLLSAVLFNYSVVLSDAGKLAEAKLCLEQALAKSPDFMPAHINLGRVHERLGNLALAVVQWSAALAKMSQITGQNVGYKTTALNQSARALEGANQDEAAEDMLRQSLEIDSQQPEAIQHFIALRQRQCKWPAVQTSERVSHQALMSAISPLSIAALTDDPLLQLATAHHYNKRDVGTPKEFLTQWPRATQNSGRLRIGYLSSDLREHAVGFLMTEVLGLHDRSAVEVFAYYCGPQSQDTLHQHFKSTSDHFVDISQLDDATAAAKIAGDGIQILIDLNGYTREARLKLVAMRPAPVIVNWLGFPGTMASPYHHYILADDFIIPPSHEVYYSEKVLRLPCYQPSNRKRTVADRPARKDVGLPDDSVVFCCFNGLHKITRFTLDRWLMILARVPQGVLWLLGGTQETNDRLHSYAESHGIAKQRIIFGDKLSNPHHLARYPLADLFLDTTPYGAHTTASDALWMGVPVLTLSGRSFASRVCGSLVTAAGINDLICSTAGEYVDRAVHLGNHPEELRTYAARLRATRDRCALFDIPGLVRQLETLYQQMWQEFEAGQLPTPHLSNLETYLELGAQVDHEAIEVQSMADYRGWWLAQIAARHAFRPVDPDARLTQLARSERPVAEPAMDVHQLMA